MSCSCRPAYKHDRPLPSPQSLLQLHCQPASVKLTILVEAVTTMCTFDCVCVQACPPLSWTSFQPSKPSATECKAECLRSFSTKVLPGCTCRLAYHHPGPLPSLQSLLQQSGKPNVLGTFQPKFCLVAPAGLPITILDSFPALKAFRNDIASLHWQ